MFDKRLFNVVHLGFGFMFVFTAFQTLGNMQKTFLDSVEADDANFSGDGYVSLAIIYSTLAFGNWISPSIIGAIGPRMAMAIGSVAYLLYVSSFIIPTTWLLYLASALLGIGSSMIWTGQGNYLTLNSDENTMSKNTGIFWTLLQMSMLFGNVYVFYAFQGKAHIDHGTRLSVATVLTVICGVGVLLFLVLRPAVSSDGTTLPRRSMSPLEAFLEAVSLLRRREMILLCVTFLYTGLELSFYSGVYSPSISNTLNISDDPKSLTGLSGIFIGIGEIAGGLIFGLLGSKTVRWGRSPIVILGFIVHLISFFLVFINLPNQSPLQETHDSAFITSSATLAIACSGLLGFADSCFNTQVISAIGTIFADESAPAFAIFKFTQSIAAAIAFFYSNAIGLYAQLGILVIWAVIGTLTFVAVEIMMNRRKRVPSDGDSESSK